MSSPDGRDDLTLRLLMLEAAIDHLPVAVFVKAAADGRFLLWNRANAELLGVTAEEALGKTDHDFFPAEQADFFRAKDLETLAAGRVVDIPEEPITSRTRGPRLLHTTKVPVYDAEGRPAFLAGISEDVTEKRRMEREIQLLGHAVRSTEECISVADLEDRLVFVNEAFLRTYGYSREELIGQPVDIVRCKRNDPMIVERILPATLEGSWRGELWNRRKDGHEFPIRLTTSAIRGEDGCPVATIGVASDITEQKRAEEALDLARRAAEAASEARSQFLANMSHEIRTPMNGILGMTRLLLDAGLDPARAEMVEAIQTSAESLLRVINDILDFSRIEAGRIEIERAPFDLQAVLEDVVEVVAPRAAEAGLELVLWYGRDAPRRLVGDGGRVRQVVLNLAGNAVKFTASGHVLVEADSICLADGSAGMRIAVHDTGIGIPRDKFPLLFREFSQVDASSARRHEGSGLGLAISKVLVELMGGKIRVVSQPQEGSSFLVDLPLDRDASSPPAAGGGTGLDGLPVLIIGRRELTRVALVELCAAWGMRSSEAESLREGAQHLAAAAASGDPFRLVLADCDAPNDSPALCTYSALAGGPPVLVLDGGRRAAGICPRSKGLWCERLATPVKRVKLLQAMRAALGLEASVPAPTAHPVFPPLVGRRALLVEDNAINQKVGTKLLEALGLDVSVAANGREAIGRALGGSYDVILMDCQMPEMDGFEATRRIRAAEGPDQRTPIVAMTARAMAGDREACLKAGMDDYLSKPVRPAELGNLLRQLLGAAAAAGAPLARGD